MKRISILIGFIAAVLGALYFYSHFWLTSNLQTVNFTIIEGEGVKQISARLHEEGVIKSMLVFESHIWLKNLGARMQTGQYEILPRATLGKLVKDLTASQDERERKITIIEGWTVRDIGFYFENLGIEQAEGFWELVGFQAIDYRKNSELPEPKNFSAKYDFLADKPSYLGLEGYLFPDTYRVRENATLEEIVKKMLDNFGTKLTPELRAEISRQEKTIFDIVRMASVVEGEVKTKEDREMVSDIFWRRLRLGMPLQADSTINYFTYKSQPRSSLNDLRKDSLWNTYKYKGLPLGPIGNPGLESILAAVYPKPNHFLYFLTDKDGNAHYAKTLEEHNKNRARYLK